MCGRFVLFTVDEPLLRDAGFLLGGGDRVESCPSPRISAPQGLPPARYNIAPTQAIAAIVPAETTVQTLLEGAPLVADTDAMAAEYYCVPARWGLLPSWKKDTSPPVLFNARGETVASKPSFRAAFARRRCLIPMDGYYEWQKKQPYFVHLPAAARPQRLFAAGLYETGLDRLSATIVTTAADTSISWLHDRMPVMLTAETAAAWIAGDPATAQTIIDNPPSQLYESLRIRPVGTAVGNVRNQGAELLAPVPDPRTGHGAAD
ncbi:SOS response-associated peptidase [Corynebacterium choanae]|nr:SOS response-associated peptidase [Corynebacterium choanae]